MAGGWAADGAEQAQIEDTINDAVTLARAALPQGESAHFCEDCDTAIPEARRLAMPGVQYCITCQQQHEHQHSVQLFNRRGSKDSQLR